MATNIDLQLSPAHEKSSAPIFILVAYIFIIIGRSHEAFPFLQPLHLGLVLSVLSFLVVLSAAFGGRISLLDWGVMQTKCLLGLLVVCVASTLFSTVIGISATFLATNIVLCVLSYYLVIACCSSILNIKIAVLSLIFTLFIMTITSNVYKGEDRWMSATASYDPNDTALILVVALPFILFLIPRTAGFLRIFLLIMVPTFTFAITRTGSRGGFIALVVVTILIIFRANVQTSRKLLFSFVLLAVFSSLSTAGYMDRISTIWSGEKDYNYTDTFGRKQVWERGLQLALNKPLMGVGPGCYEMASGLKFADDIGGFAWKGTAHNSYLLIGAETGIFGLVFYILFLLSAVRDMRKIQIAAAAESLEEDVWLAKALEASIVGFIVAAFFLSQCYNFTSYFLVGMAVAYKKILDHAPYNG